MPIQPSQDDWLEDEPDDIEAEPKSPELRAAIAEVAKRCDEASLAYQIDEYDDDLDIVVQIPSGRDTRPVWISTVAEARALLAIDFENYVYVPGYEGIWHKLNNRAEFILSARLAGRLKRQIISSESGRIELAPSSVSLPKLAIGMASEEFNVFGRRVGARMSLTLENPASEPFKKGEEVVKALEKFGSSLLYQIDHIWNVPVSLVRERRRRPVRISGRRLEETSLSYPSFEYDAAPLSLYNYARNSVGMPLLQFLAYYQAMEFYFPFFSKMEAQKRLRTVLKNPSFRAEKDSDIARLISAIKETRAGSLYDERTMMKATIREVISRDELRVFLLANGFEEYFKGDYKKVCAHKISLDPKNDNLHDQVAERLYQIRCKIVHTKGDGGDGEFDLMLPYSDEEQYLGPDVELMSFVARCCINASGVAIS
ncbi:hypothetical protein [Aurantiacibacter poecillastricola]|uniref:hypothetical protein n=1 Tax=Aurantiacibacter poecillastricola TaxID=3064385 RepID=UPI00273F79B8|nr:hypothetical protein [Aurantiacibacter sp. 219JJ12-13]MDP5263077.1 hypothetical protein [Aurantiacibacter sp. 219JJ12-13]